MLFEKILQTPELLRITASYCSENDMEVCLCPSLKDENIIILKIDDYYSTHNGMNSPPPSIDCLIIVKCEQEECYNIFLVELKDISSPKYFETDNVKKKFETTVDDFLKNRFKDIFENEKYCQFKCLFITDPYKCARNNMSQEEYLELIRAKGLKLDYFLSIAEPFEFGNQAAMITPALPTPTISSC